MRLNEIEKRMAEIKVELDTDTADIEALEKEVNELTEERKAIIDKAEKRQSLIKSIATNDTLPVIKPFEQQEERKMELTKDNVLQSKEYRSAWAKTLMQVPLNELEQRALGTALTTTATTYTAATSGTDGVNNGGLFIPEEVMMELMKRIELESPFFRDIPKTSVSGYVKFPYRKGGTGAAARTEGTPNTDGQVEWAEIELKVLEVSETIRVTWKLEAMSIDSFINFIIEELAIAVRKTIVTGVLYGNGSGTAQGVTTVSIDGEYTIGSAEGNVADIYEAISAGIGLLSTEKKLGAKIYVAADVMETMAFARDGEGRFMHNPINGVGIQKFGAYAIEMDPYLNAGDFVIGNPRYYRFNWNEPLSITRDVSGKQRINDYTAYAIASGNAEPNSFVYGKKSS